MSNKPEERCPRCRMAPPASRPDRCVCGKDQADYRHELDALMRPRAGALVPPQFVLRRVNPKTRRELVQAIERARRSTQEPQ